MDTDILVAIIAAISALVGSLIGHFLTLRELTKEKQWENRAILLPKVIEAYSTLYGILSPGVHTRKDDDKIVIFHNDASYINKTVAESMFDAITNFTASKEGAFIGNVELVQKVIPDSREYIFSAINSGELQTNGWVKVTKTKAEGSQDSLNWIRRKVLEQLSTRRMPHFEEEMGLPEKNK